MSLQNIVRGTLVAALAFGGACDDDSTGENPGQTQGSTEKKNAEDKAKQASSEGESEALGDTFTAKLEEMSDEEYPDNPNIGHRSKLHSTVDYKTVRLERRKDSRFDFEFVPENDQSPTLAVRDVDISVYTPRAPEWIRESEYMTYIGIINQEWNRQQIRFPERFEVSSDDPKWDAVSHIDIARNCLNAKLWEVIAYRKEDGKEKPFYHGWFDFPEPLYAQMFEDENGIPYDKYEKPLENWVEPANKKVDLSVVRTAQKEATAEFTSQNDEFYELKGARKKKYENIITPEQPETIQAMLKDSTRYATFDKPGFYNTDNPRKTKLGRLAGPKKITVRRIDPDAIDEPRYELDIQYEGTQDDRATRLVLGGLDFEAIPRLKESNHQKGWKMPMGIANHSFYETYEQAKNRPVAKNPYYGMLIDKKGRWIDSHKVGIDGPLMHWDAEDQNVLHVYVLSFERHAFVGHYEVRIPDAIREA